MFILYRQTANANDPRRFCKTSEGQLRVWISEENAASYAEKRKFDNWLVKKSSSEDFSAVGRMKVNRIKRSRPCYIIMDEKKMPAKKITSSGALVEIFENYEARKFAISSRAEHEKEFLVEVSQALSSTSSPDWNTRLKEVLPLIVDMCCKYRGYKAETVIERRELVAGDLEMPKNE